MSKKRSHKMEKLARIYDDEILPVWSQPFARMLLRDLTIAENSQILDIACGTGYVTLELLRRMPRGCRLIAIDASSTLLDVARRKVERTGSRDVFFRTESAEPRLSFAADVYDLVVCNLGLGEMPDMSRALADFARVVKPGGELRCTLPLEGTYQEFYDIYKEVLTKHDKHDIMARLEDHLAEYATPEDCHAWMDGAQLGDARIQVDEFSMLFKSSREFFFAPVVEFGPLARWKELAGQSQEMQDIFWYIKEAIDAYFSGRAFEVTVKAACLIGTKREASERDITSQAAHVAGAPSAENTQSAELLVDDSLIESEVTDHVKQVTGTSELDIAEIEEITDDDELAFRLASTVAPDRATPAGERSGTDAPDHPGNSLERASEDGEPGEAQAVDRPGTDAPDTRRQDSPLPDED